MPYPILVRASGRRKSSNPIRMTKYIGDLREERSGAENTARSGQDNSKKQKTTDSLPNRN